jgi:hypothetical protein
MRGEAARPRTLELLALVGIRDPRAGSMPIRTSCPAASASA